MEDASKSKRGGNQNNRDRKNTRPTRLAVAFDVDSYGESDV